MSIKLVLSHYLAGLRERNELDALLPDLLTSMGHSVLSIAQVGVNQAGVDVVSTYPDADGKKVVYLFVIKFGDVGRDGFFGGKQAVESSIREASVTFVQNRLPEELTQCEKKIVLLSNGSLKQEVQDSFAALSKEVAGRPLQQLEFWGSYQLTPLIEEHIFNEALLLAKGKGDLRAALATLEQTDVAVRHFTSFVDSCMSVPAEESTLSADTRAKYHVRRFTAAAMGWAVLLVWCRSEGNLKPGVVCGEYLLLRLWADSVRAGLENSGQVRERLNHLLNLQATSLLQYYSKLSPYLLNRQVLLGYRRETVFYFDLIFEELGRMGLTLLTLQQLGEPGKYRAQLRELLVKFLNEHRGCLLPNLDGQSIDMSLALLALIGEGDLLSSKNYLLQAAKYFTVAVRSGHWLPVDSDMIEDAVSLQEGRVDLKEFFQTSTLFPMLGTFAALMGEQACLEQLNEVANSDLKDVTLERWYPSVELETLTGSGRIFTSIGISRAIAKLQSNPVDELDASSNLPNGASNEDSFKWVDTPFEVLVAVSARFYRHPVPIWYLLKRASLYLPSSLKESTAVA